jgi:hypothetical protein
MDKTLKNELIILYRNSIHKRYDFEKVKKDPRLPKKFNKKMSNDLLNFFLENLYTEPEKREHLDAAFARLESYTSNPSKIWGLLGNLTSAIFRFGFHFPKAIKAGIKTLETHTAASRFEAELMKAAKKKKFKSPITEDQFMQCLAAIPTKQLEDFVADLGALFLMITDTVLLEKIISILYDVHAEMKVQKKTYDKQDLAAIQLGIDVLTAGNALMSSYDKTTKKEIVDFVAYSELKFIGELKKQAA